MNKEKLEIVEEDFCNDCNERFPDCGICFCSKDFSSTSTTKKLIFKDQLKARVKWFRKKAIRECILTSLPGMLEVNIDNCIKEAFKEILEDDKE